MQVLWVLPVALPVPPLLPRALANAVGHAVNAALFLFLSATTALYLLQDRLIYVPGLPPGSRDRVATPAEIDPVNMADYEDVTIVTPDNVRITGYAIFHRPQPPTGASKDISSSDSILRDRKPTADSLRKYPVADYTVLYCHANAGNMGHRLPIANVIKMRANVNVFMLSYRGYGKSDGRASERGMKIDAQAALHWIQNHPELGRTRVILYGQSIGGAVAVFLASKNPGKIAGMIVENTFLNLPKLIPSVIPVFSKLTFLCHQIWDSESAITKIPASLPLLFLSGRRDELVPSWHMDKLAKLAREARGPHENGDLDKATEVTKTDSSSVEFVAFADGTHNDTCMQAGYFDAVQPQSLVTVLCEMALVRPIWRSRAVLPRISLSPPAYVRRYPSVVPGAAVLRHNWALGGFASSVRRPHSTLTAAIGLAPFMPTILAGTRSAVTILPILYRWRLFNKYPKTMATLITILVFGVGTVLFVHIEVHPMTQRSRLMLIPEEEELRMADESFAEMIALYGHNRLHQSHPWYKRCKSVVDRLVTVVGRDLRQWELVVIDDLSIVNAMVLPNGKIFVFTGILDAIWQMNRQGDEIPSQDRPFSFLSTLQKVLFGIFYTPRDSEEKTSRFTDTLAAVLAHEMAHVLSRHSAEDLGIFIDLAHSILYTLNVNLPVFADITGRAVDVAAPYLSTLPYSRLMEIEADVVGLFLMAVSGYNPQRAVEFWKYLADMNPQSKTSFSEFTSSHPSHEHRAVELLKHESAALEIYRAHQRIEDALRIKLRREQEQSSSILGPLVRMSTEDDTKSSISELDRVNHGMFEVLQEFSHVHDVFWYARRDFDKTFVEREKDIVEKMVGAEAKAEKKGGATSGRGSRVGPRDNATDTPRESRKSDRNDDLGTPRILSQRTNTLAMPRSTVALYFLGFPPSSNSSTSADAPVRRLVCDLPDVTKLGRTIATMHEFCTKQLRNQLDDDDAIDDTRLVFYAANFTAINRSTPVSVLDDGDKVIVAYLGDPPSGRRNDKDKDRDMSGGERKKEKSKKSKEYDDDFDSDADRRGGTNKKPSPSSAKRDSKHHDHDDYDLKKKSSGSTKKSGHDSDEYESSSKKKSSPTKKYTTLNDDSGDEYDAKRKSSPKRPDDRRKDRPQSARGERSLENSKSKSMRDIDRSDDRPVWDKLRDKVLTGDVSKSKAKLEREEYEPVSRKTSTREKDKEGNTREKYKADSRDRRRVESSEDSEYDAKDKRRSGKDREFPWESSTPKNRSLGLTIDTNSRPATSGGARRTEGQRSHTAGRSREIDYY
ncbi:hypothetical protein HDU82_007609 [Entophlyctis luteolus]|nr:hypothetical protein HDU82_007609 [Entophlyctis luteolus]